MASKPARRKIAAHAQCPHCRSASLMRTVSEKGGDAYFCNTCRRWLSAPPAAARRQRGAVGSRKKG
jgi:hypothetical protein